MYYILVGRFSQHYRNIGKKAIKLASILLLTVLVISLIRNLTRASEAKKRVEKARERVERLEQENRALEEKAKVVASDEYLEKQLRDGLGLAKEGEIILVLPDPEILRSLAPTEINEEDELPLANWEKWMRLFL